MAFRLNNFPLNYEHCFHRVLSWNLKYIFTKIFYDFLLYYQYSQFGRKLFNLVYCFLAKTHVAGHGHGRSRPGFVCFSIRAILTKLTKINMEKISQFSPSVSALLSLHKTLPKAELLVGDQT